VLMHIANLTLGLIPQPAPVQPDGIGDLFTKFGGWLFWSCGAGMLFGMLGVALRLSLGRGRSQMSAGALGDLPMILLSGLIAVSAAGLVTAVIGF